MSHTLTLRKIETVTHDTRHLVFDKPAGFDFVPGQGTAMRLHRAGGDAAEHPLSFVSLPGDGTLDFIVETRPVAEPDGTAAQLATLEPGEQVTISEPFDVIEDRGPGVFIAAGAGIVPFIALLRRRARDGDGLSACMLFYCSRTEADIILRDELVAMAGLNTIFTVTDDPQSALPHRKIDGAYLDEVVEGYRERFYICGPDETTRHLVDVLRARDVPEDHIIRRQR